MKRLLLAVLMFSLASVCQAATITSVNMDIPIVWSILEQDAGFEKADISILETDKTHITVTIAPKFEVSAKDFKDELAKYEDTEKVSVKVLRGDVRLSTSALNIKNDELSFIVEHPEKLEVGWKVKIGTNSATVGTTTATAGFSSSNRRYSHYANGNYWVAFHDGTEPVIYSSPDKSTWTSRGAIFTTPDPLVADWGVRFTGTTMYAAGGNADSTYFEKYTLNANGTITKDTTRDETVADTGANSYANPNISNTGKVFVSEQADADQGAHYLGDATFETWTQKTGTPDMGTSFTDMVGFDSATASNDDDLLYIGLDPGGNNLRATFYDYSDNACNAREDIATGVVNDTTKSYSAVRITSGEIHIIYMLESDDPIVHKKRGTGEADTWSSVSASITGATTHNILALSHDGDTLYTFYDKDDNNIYYRSYTAAGGWGDESTLKSDGTAIVSAIAVYEEKTNNEICVSWVEGAGSPYNVEFDCVSFEAPPSGRTRRMFISMK